MQPRVYERIGLIAAVSGRAWHGRLLRQRDVLQVIIPGRDSGIPDILRPVYRIAVIGPRVTVA